MDCVCLNVMEVVAINSDQLLLFAVAYVAGEVLINMNYHRQWENH